MLEDATRLVSAVDMFSNNENFEEVATENIKYFLLPALLGKLTTKICGNDDRMHLVKVAEIYFVDFLKRLKTYDLTDVKIPEIDSIDEKNDDGNNSDVSNRHPPRMLEDMVGYSYFCY
jgi:immunoglobulin-binding protein 1